jgi:hypothetical protein
VNLARQIVCFDGDDLRFRCTTRSRASTATAHAPSPFDFILAGASVRTRHSAQIIRTTSSVCIDLLAKENGLI